MSNAESESVPAPELEMIVLARASEKRVGVGGERVQLQRQERALASERVPVLMI